MSTIELSTGKQIEANAGVVGIDKYSHAFEGYDGQLDGYGWSAEKDDFVDNLLSIEDRIALADYAIGLWKKYKTQARTEQLKRKVDELRNALNG